MKKLVLLAASAAATAVLFGAPSPASASCHVIVEGGGCVESAVCNAVGNALDRTPVKHDDLNCIE
jgi:hypothetical protein